jgi:peptidoglycan/LPS O-acetylase OafA/YrhL
MTITLERPQAAQREVEVAPTTELRKRDRYIDSLRCLALVRVMTYHVFGWAWLPVLFPSMGVMFALAGALVASSLDRSPGDPWRVLKKRTIRLLPPLWLFGLVVVPVMVVAGWTYSDEAGAPLHLKTMLLWILPISDPPGSEFGYDWVVPLWYIRAYLWFLLLSPAALWLFRHWLKRMMAVPITVVALSAVGLFPLNGRTGDVVLSMAMFGGCWMLGFAHHDNRIRPLPLVKVIAGGLVLMALGLAWALTHTDPQTGWDIDNIPLADTLYSLGAVLILLRLYPDFSWMEKRVVLDKFVTVVNSRAMTIYLWGNLAIFLSNPVLDLWSVTANLDQDNAWGYAQTYLMSWLIVVACVLAFGWCEDLAARRPLRINPWPRGHAELERMRTRKVLTFPRPAWMREVTTSRLLLTTGALAAAAATASSAVLSGTASPGRRDVADAPARGGLNPRPLKAPPANLGQGNGQSSDLTDAVSHTANSVRAALRGARDDSDAVAVRFQTPDGGTGTTVPKVDPTAAATSASTVAPRLPEQAAGRSDSRVAVPRVLPTRAGGAGGSTEATRGSAARPSGSATTVATTDRAPEPSSTGDRAPEPSSTGDRTPEPSSTGDRTPEPSSTGDRAPEPSSTGDRVPEPSSTRDRVPEPSSTRDRKPDPATSPRTKRAERAAAPTAGSRRAKNDDGGRRRGANGDNRRAPRSGRLVPRVLPTATTSARTAPVTVPDPTAKPTVSVPPATILHIIDSTGAPVRRIRR